MSTRSLLPPLSALRDAVERLLAKSLPWDDVVPADRVLPSGTVVEAWYLAGFFLRMWANELAQTEWKRIMVEGRGTSYGRAGGAGFAAGTRTKQLALDLSLDRVLDQHLAAHLRSLATSLESRSLKPEYAGSVVRSVVEAHEWCVTLRVLEQTQRGSELESIEPPLRELKMSTRSLVGEVREWASILSGSRASRVAELLTYYRNSTFAFSWMPYCEGGSQFGGENPLFPTEREKAVFGKLAEEVASEFKGIDGIRTDLVRSVVERIGRAVLERGYPGFAKDIAMPGTFANVESAGDELPINVIPGGESGHCASLLVAVARSGRASGMSRVLPQVRKHLIDCNEITNAVVIVSDEWKPNVLGESLDDLKSHVARGKKIVFLLAAQPGRSIVRMPIDLS